jgi:hypothetical protein
MGTTVSKPVIIDYPEDRRRLKEEFDKIASSPGFAESVQIAVEMIYGKKALRSCKFGENGLEQENNDNYPQYEDRP